jgi:hypothetical protein
MQHIEGKIQEQVVAYLRYQYPQLLFTASIQEHAGGKFAFSNIQKANRRKRMGYLAGTPDLMIFCPKGIYGGLFIEMKSEKGTVSHFQKTFGERATINGYCYVVCHSLHEAQQAVEKYLLQ